MFESADGSRWKYMLASRLSALEIWKGNRVLDQDHVSRIQESLHGNIKLVNLTPFRIVSVQTEDGPVKYIIDGQHRAKLLKQHFMNPDSDDFEVIVIEKECSTEAEIIDLFKIVNTVKSIQWKEDPVLVANKYIEAFLKEFNPDPKNPNVRTGKTVRPFMSVDKLRDALISKHVVEWKTTPAEFVEKAKEFNSAYLPKLSRDVPMQKKAIDRKFSLGLADFNWF